MVFGRRWPFRVFLVSEGQSTRKYSCKEMLRKGGGVKGDVLDEISLMSYNSTFSFVLTYFPLYLYSKLL